tara:strand:- start:268 stop:975 length:708 start_codon:yes stop_codon:yes gene_type:complete
MSKSQIVTGGIADDAISEEHLDSTLITAQTEKSTLADADKFLISDSAASNALKYVQKSNLGAGGLIKISSGNWSSGTDTLSFSSVFDGTYKNYVLYVNAVYSSSDFRIGIQVERGGGYISSTNYHFACQGVNAAGTETTDSNNNSDRITTNPANAHGGAATKTYNAIIQFLDPYNSATYTQIGGDITAWLASDNGSFAQFGGADLTAGSCTGFRLLTSAGTLGANAPYALYGVKS